jgi:hypothetical protein
MEYVRQANAAFDCCKFVSSDSWLQTAVASSSTSTRDVRLTAHARACARIIDLLGPELGALPRTVGDCHYSSPLLAKRASELLERAAGGPSSHCPSTASLVHSRPRRGTPAAASFARAQRWGEGREDRLLAAALAPSAAPSSSAGPVAGSEEVLVSAVGMRTAGSWAAAAASAEEEDSWEGVELGEGKEAEEEEGAASRGSSALALALRRLGARRALERSVLGHAATPANFVQQAACAQGQGVAAADPTLAVRAWPTGPVSIPPLTALHSHQRLRLAAVAYRHRRSAQPSSSQLEASAAGAAYLDPAPHKVLPIGPLALPQGVAAAEGSQARAAEARAVMEAAEHSRQAAAQQAAEARGEAGRGERQQAVTGRESKEAVWARNRRALGELHNLKLAAEADGRQPKSALQLWREEQQRAGEGSTK